MSHVGQIAMLQSPAGRMPPMDQWARTMSAANDAGPGFARTGSAGFQGVPVNGLGGAEGALAPALMGQWDPSAVQAMSGTMSMPVELWHPHMAHLGGFAYGQDPHMLSTMYAMHNQLQAFNNGGRPHGVSVAHDEGGKGKKGRGKNKAGKGRANDAEVWPCSGVVFCPGSSIPVYGLS